MRTKSKFVMNIGPGTTIGAMAIGDGVRVEGSIRVDTPAVDGPPDRVKANIEIRGASPARAAKWLRMMASSIEDDHSQTFTKVSENEPGASVAWSWEADK